MRTLVFTPVTFNLAETTRMIEIARAMPTGWRCVFAIYEPEFAELVKGAGFEWRQLEPVLTEEGIEQTLALDQGRGLKNPFTADLVRLRVAAERALIREAGAEAVVMGTNVTSLLSARAEGIPLFYAVPFGLTRPHVAQSDRLGLKPGDGFNARNIDRLATRLMRFVYLKAPVAPRSFRVVARENGVPGPRAAVDLVEGDVNLLTVMVEELEGYSLPSNYRRVGPIFARLDGEVPDEVVRLSREDKPLVYLALGSSGNRALALKAAVALGSLEINVVAPIKGFLDASDQVPSNVHLVDLLPAHKLGGIVDAAVLHGGQGTVQTACATGVPFVGMGLQPEQTWNVDVCARAGNAVALRPADVTKPVFLDAVRRVLSDPAIRAAADRVQREYAKEDGSRAAAEAIIEELNIPSIPS